MSAMPLWALPISYALHIFQMWTPKKLAVIGKTRVRYNFKMLADQLLSEQNKGFDPFASGTGIVVAYEYEYVGPSNRLNLPVGKYTGNTKFPKGYIVQPDGGGPLVCVPLENAKLLSGYRHAIPGWYDKGRPDIQRIGDLPQALLAYPHDVVRLKNDPLDVERRVNRIFFTPRGEPVYEVLMTSEEVRLENERRKEEARIHNENRAPGDDWERGWVHCEEGETHSWVRGGEMVVIKSVARGEEK